jgi:hypothetical protein
MERDPAHTLLARQSELDQRKSGPVWPPRFSLRRLLESIAAIGAGTMLVGWLFLLPNGKDPSLLAFIVCWFGGGVLLGLGVFNFFGRPILGAAIGFAVQLGIVVVILLMYLTHPAIG